MFTYLPLDSVQQSWENIWHVSAKVTIPPEQLLLLLGDLAERVTLLNVAEEGELRAGGLHLPGLLLGVEPREELGVLLDLLVVREHDRVGAGLELH